MNQQLVIRDSASGPLEQPAGDVIDLRALWFTFRRRLGLFFGIAAVVLALVIIVTFQMTPQYTASASVLLNLRQSDVVDLGAVMSGLPSDSATVDTEVEVLRSRTLARRVADALNLYEDPEFNPALREVSGFSAWLGGVRQSLRNLLSAAAPETIDLLEVQDDPTEARVVGNLLNRLTVRRQGLTHVMDVAISSEQPQKASRIANAYANAYLTDQLEAKFEATERANIWLSDRLEALREEVLLAERAVEAYRAEAGLLSARGSTLTEQQIGDLSAQAVLRRAELAEAQARLSTVRRQIASGAQQEVAEVLGSEVIRQLRGQRAEVVRRQADLLSRYGDRHPDVINIRRQLADIDAEIDLEGGRIVASLEGAVAIAQQRLTAIETSTAQLRNELSVGNQAEVRLRELERDAEAVRTLYESFLTRFRQTSEQETLQAADARIISLATVPTRQSSPNWRLNLALGLVLAGMAGIGVVFAAEMFDRGLSTAAQAERIFGVPSLALIPIVPKKYRTENRVADYVLDKPLSGYAEALRGLRAGLLFTRGRESAKVITITSALPGEGKTATAFALARVSSMLGSPTIVIDADIRRRILTHAGHLHPEAGLIEVLLGEAPLESAIVREEKTGLHILPLTSKNVGASDIFGRAEMRSLLGELRKKYDMVVIDTAPALPVAETRILATLVDSVVLLARWRKTSRDVVQAALTNLRQVDAPIAGIALTQVDLAAEGRYSYGHGYGKSYYQSYRKYYSD